MTWKKTLLSVLGIAVMSGMLTPAEAQYHHRHRHCSWHHHHRVCRWY